MKMTEMQEGRGNGEKRMNVRNNTDDRGKVINQGVCKMCK